MARPRGEGDIEMRYALFRYAQTFPGGPIGNNESVEKWYARTAPKLMGVPHERGLPFLAILTACMKVAFDLTDKDLDDLLRKPTSITEPPDPITGAPVNAPTVPTNYRPSISNPMGPNKYPVPNPIRLSTPTPPVNPTADKARIYAPIAPSRYGVPQTLGEKRAADESKKKAAGWKGADSLPHDSDYD
jgi:hypothetical protein